MFGINKDIKLHFIGIGGIGMSGIAEILLNLGYKISGSDISEGNVVEKLRKLGAEIYIGHKANNIQNVQLIIYSSAIDNSNPEIQKAIENKIPIIKRAEMLAELMRLKYGIAVAGSHGKTTTTSMLATIFSNLNQDPTHIIGGIVSNLGGHAKTGKGQYLIAEADESDGSFLYLNPIMSVITNIDNDHLDYYKTSDAIVEAFVQFAHKIPFYGKVALNAHDENSIKIIPRIKRSFVIFGIKDVKAYVDVKDIDYLADNIKDYADGVRFDLIHKGKTYSCEINLPGQHNVLNAIAAMGIAHEVGMKLDDCVNAIKHFNGVGRRLETIFKNDKCQIIDDYGHHPTEVNATLKTINDKYKGKDITVIFEPHRYTRTQNFWNEFIAVLSQTKKCYLLPIYNASEEVIPYIDAELMAKKVNEINGSCGYLKDVNALKDVILAKMKTDSVVLCMGAGPISKNVRAIIENEYNRSL